MSFKTMHTLKRLHDFEQYQWALLIYVTDIMTSKEHK